MEENSRIIELIARKTARSASPEEMEELARLLREHPEQGYLMEVLGSLKGNRGHLETVTPGAEIAQHGWSALSGRLEEQQREGRSNVFHLFRTGAGGWIVKGAACVLVIAGVWLFRGYRVRQGMATAAKASRGLLVAEAGYGQTKQLVLSDGTRVRLNAGSRLTYPDIFSGGRRDVQLEGEAFFEVAKDMNAPFSVHAGKIRIGVLGTSFDVKAYKEESKIETTLISGKVEVRLDSEPERAILLSPHEKLTIPNDVDEDEDEAGEASGKAAERTYNALRYEVQRLPMKKGVEVVETAWLSDKLVFNDERFESVARLLERRYDVDIQFGDERLKEERISGVFDRERIERVLEILEMTTGFRHRMEGKTIILSNK